LLTELLFCSENWLVKDFEEASLPKSGSGENYSTGDMSLEGVHKKFSNSGSSIYFMLPTNFLFSSLGDESSFFDNFGDFIRFIWNTSGAFFFDFN
jgi:hypothetical protein